MFIDEPLLSMYSYRYPHPALTADCVLFCRVGQQLKVLLIQRGNEPYKGCWAFPGGFMNMDETTEQCALRELREETGLEIDHVQQLGVYSAVDRDPRERVVTVAYYAVIDQLPVQGGDDAAHAQWLLVDELPPLAFDHNQILLDALQRLVGDEQCGK